MAMRFADHGCSSSWAAWPVKASSLELIVLLYILDSRGPTKLLSFTQTLASLLTDLLDICSAHPVTAVHYSGYSLMLIEEIKS